MGMGPFGEHLRRERERQGITLDDISLSSKIGVRFLRALEEENFDQLPGGIFNKAFVKAYAKHIGMDEGEAVSGYLKASGLEPPAPSKMDPLPEAQLPEPRPDPRDRFRWQSIATVAVALVFAFSLWQFYSRVVSKRHAGERVSNSEASGTNSSQVAGENSRDSIPGQASDARGSGVVASAAYISKSGAPFTLLIKAEDDCWLAITADGKPVMEYTLLANQEKSIQAQREIVVKAGNVGALDIWFSGKRLPSQGDDGEVKTLAFGPAGLEPLPAHSDVPSRDGAEATR
jgi:cytoskeleton protein RodZ